MSSRLLRGLAVVALTFALGGHWALLQSVAWVTMVAGYSQAGPFKEALVNTFDGKHPCPICRFVAREKKSEQKQETQKLLTKLDFFLQPSGLTLYAPRRIPSHFSAVCFSDMPAEAPPTPPPRRLPG
ncbi:MAG TPA: hypothetical protein VN887_05335 [Candidatus Angelobacter sp.]|nr:hypothetical protein [Candidatus Angelobacter sp.]